MKLYGIKKIYYSDDAGNIVYEKMKNMQNNHVSQLNRVLGKTASRVKG